MACYKNESGSFRHTFQIYFYGLMFGNTERSECLFFLYWISLRLTQPQNPTESNQEKCQLTVVKPMFQLNIFISIFNRCIYIRSIAWFKFFHMSKTLGVTWSGRLIKCVYRKQTLIKFIRTLVKIHLISIIIYGKMLKYKDKQTHTRTQKMIRYS